jgi:ABC-type phosphate/phosphonate transport system ATPase subunit
MISHDIDRALDYCNKVIEIKKGEVTYNGEPSKYLLEGGAK